MIIIQNNVSNIADDNYSLRERKLPFILMQADVQISVIDEMRGLTPSGQLP